MRGEEWDMILACGLTTSAIYCLFGVLALQGRNPLPLMFWTFVPAVLTIISLKEAGRLSKLSSAVLTILPIVVDIALLMLPYSEIIEIETGMVMIYSAVLGGLSGWALINEPY